jgi:predicted phosphodiesterase
MSDQEMLALVGEDPADIIVCGGSHVPFHRRLDDIQVINVGSVGEAPTPNFAHATLLDASSFGITIEQFEVEIG